MKFLNDLLYWIANGMLAPAIVLVLAAFAAALLLLGNLYAQWSARLARHAALQTLLDRARHSAVREIEFMLPSGGALGRCLADLAAAHWHPLHGAKRIADFELACQKELERCQLLLRAGPMLGLVGTLVPMGPALVALAAGDMATMAVNMQVAFSTTIVGICVGAIGFVAQLVKKRWFNGDATTLHYLLELAAEPAPAAAEARP